MKKISQRKTGILICILAAVCILAVSVQVQAASKKVIFAKSKWKCENNIGEKRWFMASYNRKKRER